MGHVENNAKTTGKKRGGITGKGFLPGVSGNAGGRPRKTPVTDALRKMLEEDPKLAMRAAKALFAQVFRKNGPVVQAFREIADRVDGKSAERVEVTGEDGEAIQFKSDDIDGKILELAARIRARHKEKRTKDR